MAVWERYDDETTLAAVGSHTNREVFHNFQGDENFESSDVVIVDGIMTFITDTDDLCGARLLVVPEEILTAALTEDIPQPHNDMVYYSWFVARGPMVFRLRSKRTIPPEHKLWMQVWKATTGGGTTSTTVRWGAHLLFVVKH